MVGVSRLTKTLLRYTTKQKRSLALSHCLYCTIPVCLPCLRSTVLTRSHLARFCNKHFSHTLAGRGHCFEQLPFYAHSSTHLCGERYSGTKNRSVSVGFASGIERERDRRPLLRKHTVTMCIHNHDINNRQVNEAI